MGVIIAVVGMCGSGKSVLTEYLIEKGFSKLRFGQITMDKLKENNLEINEKNERLTREKLREQYGMAAYAILNIPKIKELIKSNERIVLDGLYSWEEYLVLKKEFPGMIVIAVYASPETRYKRLNSRKVRPLSNEESCSRDKSEIENVHKAGPIAMADFTLVNESSLENLKNNLELLFKKTENEKKTK
ncbi:AAA family ATPase [Candidatus Woesearchaeota archaeon]|nr:AAA family ATPase [Candidatus Woesearchaeota archaeon]